MTSPPDRPGFDVREARPDEYTAIGELTAEAYRLAGETDDEYAVELRDVATRAAAVPVLVAVETGGGRVLGSVTYVPGPGPYHEGEFGEDASFRMLAVAPDARGRGIGAALVGACIERAVAAGRASISIHTRPFMTDAHRLYERLGFERAPDLDWEFEPGEWLYVYRLRLPSGALPASAGRPGRAERPERRRGAEAVEPRPAATLVLLRPGPVGLEVLLTRRHRRLRFGGDLYVFPGGRLDPGDADHAAAAVRETREEAGIEVAPSALIPLTRWVTPAGLPARFDARFFAAIVPPDTDVTIASDEVTEWRWLTPVDALESVAAGDLEMWQPTVVTLQQLVGLSDARAIARAFEAGAPTQPPSFDELDVGLVRVTQPWAEGIEGRTEPGWIVGDREWVLVNPSDPTGETADAIEGRARRVGARVVAVAITDLEPRHHAGVEVWAAGLSLPVVGGVGSARFAPYPIRELGDGDAVPYGDVPLVARVDRSGGRRETVRYDALGWSLPDREPARPGLPA